MNLDATRATRQTAAWILVAALAAAAQGSTIAYDGFGNGPLGDLDGSAGGVGWSGPWQNVNSSLFTSVGGTGLTYPMLRNTAGAARTPAGGSFDAASYSRTFGALPTPANHAFFSFLLRPDAGMGTYGGISFGGYSLIGMPLTMNTYGMRLGRYLFVDTGINVVQGQTTLLVLELQVVAGQTVYRLYVNPDLSRGRPSTPDAEYTMPGGTLPQALELDNDGGFTTDELRIATTWAEAVPPPTGVCFSTTGPAPAAACEGGQATFTVSPTGSTGPFTYEWYKGPTLLADGPTGLGSTVSGSATPAVTISGLGAADAGFYYAVVTDPCGSVTSSAATLTVSNCADCPADFNRDGGVDGADVEAFFTVWEAGDPAADVNRDGGVDGSDVEVFFRAWEAGGCG